MLGDDSSANMGFEDLTPRMGLVVGLLALFPIIWYAFGVSVTAGIVSAVNVLLILTVLFVAFGPVSNGHRHGSGASEHDHGSGSDGQDST